METINQWGQRIVRLVDYLYDEWSVRLALIIFVTYVAPLNEKRAYVCVPLAMLLLPVLVASFVLFCHRQGLFRWLRDTLHRYLSAAFVAALLGINRLEQSKMGQFFLRLALCNLVFLVYLAYKHIDLLRLGREFFGMVVTFVSSLARPVEILAAFDSVLRSLSVLEVMNATRAHYVDRMIKDIDAGYTSVIGPILATSVVLFLAGLVSYAIRNFCLRFVDRPQQQQAD